ncbi:MAG: hypothetical protein ACOYKA_00020 [Legionellaceae bacterium]
MLSVEQLGELKTRAEQYIEYLTLKKKQTYPVNSKIVIQDKLQIISTVHHYLMNQALSSSERLNLIVKEMSFSKNIKRLKTNTSLEEQLILNAFLKTMSLDTEQVIDKKEEKMERESTITKQKLDKIKKPMRILQAYKKKNAQE